MMAQTLSNEAIPKRKSTSIDRQTKLPEYPMINNQTDLVILDALLSLQPATRTALCHKTGIARTTIYDSLTRLMLKKLVMKYSVPAKTRGRPKVYYTVVQEYL